MANQFEWIVQVAISMTANMHYLYSGYLKDATALYTMSSFLVGAHVVKSLVCSIQAFVCVNFHCCRRVIAYGGGSWLFKSSSSLWHVFNHIS